MAQQGGAGGASFAGGAGGATLAGGAGGAGVGGSPPSVLGDAELLTQSLIAHRDGIVGVFTDAHFIQQAQQNDTGHIEDNGQLWRWDDWVRASVYDFELVSNLAFAPSKSSGPLGGVSLWHRGLSLGTNQPAKPPKIELIVEMYRPDEQTFVEQLQFMDRYSDLRGERANETLIQMGPQTAYWGAILNLSPMRTPKTLELLNTVIRFSIVVEMRFKHALACTRAIDHSAQVQPMIATPGHGTLPSGHSTQAYIIAEVMWAFFRDLLQEPRKGTKKTGVDSLILREQLLLQAHRVAVNRTIAGVHFPVDSSAGHVLGSTLAEYFVARCIGDPSGKVRATYIPRGFRGDLYIGTQDFDPSDRLDQVYAPPPASQDSLPSHIELHSAVTSVERSMILAWMWKQARNEWNGKSLAGNRVQPGEQS